MIPSRGSFLKLCSGVAGFAGASHSLIAGRTHPAGRVSIGAQTNTFGVPIRGYDHLLSVLDVLAGLGYQGFETNQLSLAPYAERAGEVRKAFEARHIPLIAPHSGGKLGLLGKEESETELERLHQIARWAAQMGATYFIFSGAKLSEQDGKLDAKQVHRRMAELNRLGQTCKQEGLQLCYHNEIQDLQVNPTEMSYLLRDTAGLNTVSGIAAGESWWARAELSYRPSQSDAKKNPIAYEITWQELALIKRYTFTPEPRPRAWYA